MHVLFTSPLRRGALPDLRRVLALHVCGEPCVDVAPAFGVEKDAPDRSSGTTSLPATEKHWATRSGRCSCLTVTSVFLALASLDCVGQPRRSSPSAQIFQSVRLSVVSSEVVEHLVQRYFLTWSVIFRDNTILPPCYAMASPLGQPVGRLSRAAVFLSQHAGTIWAASTGTHWNVGYTESERPWHAFASFERKLTTDGFCRVCAMSAFRPGASQRTCFPSRVLFTDPRE